MELKNPYIERGNFEIGRNRPKLNLNLKKKKTLNTSDPSITIDHKPHRNNSSSYIDPSLIPAQIRDKNLVEITSHVYS